MKISQVTLVMAGASGPSDLPLASYVPGRFDLQHNLLITELCNSRDS